MFSCCSLSGIGSRIRNALSMGPRYLWRRWVRCCTQCVSRPPSRRGTQVPAHQGDDYGGNYVGFVVDYLPTAVENADYHFISTLMIFHKEFIDIWDVLGLVMERYPSFQDNCENDKKAKRAVTELLGIWMDRIPQDFCESPYSPAMLSKLKVYVTRNMPSSHLADRVQQLLSVLVEEDDCESDNTQEEEVCGLDSVSTGSSELQAQDDTVGTPEALQVGPASPAVPTGDLPPKEELLCFL